ncbi:hypothetical protein [Corynebacterium sp. 20_84]
MLSRTSKVPNPYSTFPSFRELSRSEDRVDCLLKSLNPSISTLDFDLKREPLVESGESVDVAGHELFGFDTRAWATVYHYDKARSIGQHMQNHRPGAFSETGCLRTREEWETFHRRYRSGRHRRVRTAGSALLSEIVAAHKTGLINVPALASKRLNVAQKLEWLCSLGLGEFTRSQWEHMSKKARQKSVLDDADLGVVREFLDTVDGGVA